VDVGASYIGEKSDIRTTDFRFQTGVALSSSCEGSAFFACPAKAVPRLAQGDKLEQPYPITAYPEV
jgi:hypothetical protein